MPSALSKQGLELLGYSDITEVPQKTRRPWKRYDASVMAGVRTVVHSFAYLQSSCSLDDAKNLFSSVLISDNFFLITPKSGISVTNLRKIFGTIANISIYKIWIDTINWWYIDYQGYNNRIAPNSININKDKELKEMIKKLKEKWIII